MRSKAWYHSVFAAGAVALTLAGLITRAADPPPAPGSLDRSFAADVRQFALALALALQPDGRLLVGGFESLARLEVRGARDPSFVATVGAHNFIHTIAVRGDETILAGGHAFNPTTRFTQLVWLDPSGRTKEEIPPAFDGTVYEVLVRADDSILVAGGFTNVVDNYTYIRGGIALLEPVEGHLDTRFDPGLGADQAILAVAFGDQGRILVGGSFTNFDRVPMAGIARLSAQGRLDLGFTPRFNDGNVQDLAVQSDGRILIAGNSSRTSRTSRPRDWHVCTRTGGWTQASVRSSSSRRGHLI